MNLFDTKEYLEQIVNLAEGKHYSHRFAGLDFDGGVYLDIDVLKITEGKLSFGYHIVTKRVDDEVKCGVNEFRGETGRLLLGYFKSLLLKESIKRSGVACQRLRDTITNLSKLLPEPPVDENKIDLSTWQPPFKFNSSFLN